MADAVATVHAIGRVDSTVKRVKYSFTLTTVGTSSTGSEQKLDGIHCEGVINQIKVASASTDFDISIKNKSGASANTLNEIYRFEAINLMLDDAGLGINYRNEDTTLTNALYVTIKNDDGGNATGAITLEIYADFPSK